jgi:integrase
VGEAEAGTFGTAAAAAAKADLLASGLSPASVNRLLAALRRAFNLAVWSELLPSAPKITLLPENNIREGFVTPEQFRRIIPHLPPHLQDVARHAFLSAWRVGEILQLRWSQVELKPRSAIIELRADQTKGKRARRLPCGGALFDLLRARWQRRHGPYVYHRAGRQIKSYRQPWKTAVKRAGIPGLHFHDLRRSAIRLMEQAGVPRSVGMAISGHQTESVYRRYAIVDEADISQGLDQLGNLVLGKLKGGSVEIPAGLG